MPADLQKMLLDGLEPGFEIEHGEFAWHAHEALIMKFRLSVTKGGRKPQIWEIEFAYPAKEATAVSSEASAAERKWFTLMVRSHIAEWWANGPSVVTSARLIK